MNEIESSILTQLYGFGINSDNVKSTEVGNYWRHHGKEFLISKKLEISLTDFSLINQIISTIDRKGIEYMRIGELKNKKLVDYRKEVKKQALKAAKEKAEYLLETIDKNLGDIITIEEINSDYNFWTPESMLSNSIIPSKGNSESDIEKKIKLRYEIKAKFEIK